MNNSTKLERLTASLQQLEEQKDDINRQIKETNRAISKERRTERDKHLHSRGDDLTKYLGDNTELFTDEDVAMFLKYVFSFSGIERVLNQMREIRSGESEITMTELFENARTTPQTSPQTAPQTTSTEERFSATS